MTTDHLTKARKLLDDPYDEPSYARVNEAAAHALVDIAASLRRIAADEDRIADDEDAIAGTVDTDAHRLRVMAAR